MNGEKGQALPLAILALTIGALVVAPFLGHAGGSLIGSRVYGEAIAQQNACDAGVEHAIWSLTRGSLAEEFAQPGDEVTYHLDETVNGFAVTVTVTANATGGGGMAGDITDTVIDTLEFDTSNCYEPSIVNVSGNIYAIAYRGTSNDGFLKTVSIAADGNIHNSVIDTLEFDTANGYEPCIVHVSGNTYAIAYRGTSADGFVITVSIAANGDIGNSVIDTLEYDTANGYEPSIIYVSGNVYAIAYRGTSADGFLKTVSIAANGDIGNSVIDTLEFDTSDGYEPDIANISGNVFAIAYRGPSNDGFIKTVTIAANGAIGNSVIDTREFMDNNCYELRIVRVVNDIFTVAYRGPSNQGYLKTVSIAVDGDIADALIDTLVFDNSASYEPFIINVSGSIFAIAYRGQSNDGFIKTVEISSTGGSAAAYEIVAAAADRTIRASINTDNATVYVTSWQIE
jgi:hypothetical protein